MRRLRLRFFATAIPMLVALGFGPDLHAQGQGIAVCRGQDLLAQLARDDPVALARVEAAAAKVANGEAILWKVSRAGGRASHLFGTIHISDDRVTALSPAVTQALAAADRVVLEVADVSPQVFALALQKLRSRLVYDDGRSLATQLAREEMSTASTVLAKAGFPTALHGQLRPWFVTMMLALPDCERERMKAGLLALDLQIGAAAKARGVAVAGLETLEDQMRAMASIPEADQLGVLKATLKSHSRIGDVVETMVRRYLGREMTKVLPLQAEMIRAAGADPAGFASFYNALLTLRNPRMRDAALPHLAKGNAFIAVGALHLIGEDGLVALLRAAGYEIAPVE